MYICQYTTKKALLMAFLSFFCFSYIAYADPQTPPNLIVSPEIKNAIDKFVNDFVNAELVAKLKEIDAMFPEPRSADDKRRAAAAKEAARAAAEASKEILRTQLMQACFEAKCQTDTVKKMAEAYVIKTEASKMIQEYMKFMDGFIADANKQSAEMKAALDKLNAGIANGNATVNAWWNIFGIGQSALTQAQYARAYAEAIAKRIKEINEILARLKEDLKDLQDGMKNNTISPKTAAEWIAYDRTLVADIQRLLGEIIGYMQRPELAAVIAKNAPEIDLAAKIKAAQELLDQVNKKIKESESERAEQMQQQLLNVLPIPVDITRPLPPQLAIPPRARPIPPAGTDPFAPTNPPVTPAPTTPSRPTPTASPSRPANPPIMPPPTTYRLQWPILNIFGQPTGSYDVFEYPSSEKNPTPYNGVYKGRISPQQGPIQALPSYDR